VNEEALAHWGTLWPKTNVIVYIFAKVMLSIFCRKYLKPDSSPYSFILIDTLMKLIGITIPTTNNNEAK